MKAKEYNFKYKFLYPLLGILLYFLLSLMTIYLVKSNFDFLDTNLISELLLFTFLAEAVIHFNAAREIKVPVVTIIIEFGFYLLLLVLFNGRYQNGIKAVFSISNLDLFLFWFLSVFLWGQIYELCRLFEIFRKDFAKIYDRSSENWSLDEFRRLLDYPLKWPKLTKKISWLNLPLLLLWAVMGEFNKFYLLLTIIFLVAEVFLLALLYFDKKTADWKINGIERTESVSSGWRKFLLIFIITALFFAFILPSNYQPLPMAKIRSWLQSKEITTQAPEMGQPKQQPARPEAGPIKENVEKESSPWLQIIFLILQFIIAAGFVLFLLFLLGFLFKTELTKFKNIPQFFKDFYHFILEAFKNIFIKIKEINIKMRSNWQKRRKKSLEQEENKKELAELKDIDLSLKNRSIIQNIYNSFLKLLALKGLGKKSAATPYEYQNYISKKFKNLEEEIKGLTNIFVKSAYSDQTIGEDVFKKVKSIWQRLKKKL